jgi:hypothetical protein
VTGWSGENGQLDRAGGPTAYLGSMNGSLTATISTSPCSRLAKVVEVRLSFLAERVLSTRSEGQNSRVAEDLGRRLEPLTALHGESRLTILPIRPKPLMPTWIHVLAESKGPVLAAGSSNLSNHDEDLWGNKS